MSPKKRASTKSSQRVVGKKPKVTQPSNTSNTDRSSDDIGFGIPQRSPKEAVEFLAALKIRVKVDELVQPKQEIIRPILMLILAHFTPLRLEKMRDNREQTEDNGEEMKADPIYVELKSFLKEINYTDIKKADVVKPTRRRLLNILSVIYNFYRFQQSQVAYATNILNTKRPKKSKSK